MARPICEELRAGSGKPGVVHSDTDSENTKPKRCSPKAGAKKPTRPELRVEVAELKVAELGTKAARPERAKDRGAGVEPMVTAPQADVLKPRRALPRIEEAEPAHAWFLVGDAKPVVLQSKTKTAEAAQASDRAGGTRPKVATSVTGKTNTRPSLLTPMMSAGEPKHA